MITTVKSNITWDGPIAKVLSQTSNKKIKATLKDMTGAVDVDIIEVNSWDEEDEEDS